MFGVPFDEIGPIVGRSPVAARQLASRARRRVQGATAGPAGPGAGPAREREIVSAFLAASRGGDFEALIRLLDPDVGFEPTAIQWKQLPPTRPGAHPRSPARSGAEGGCRDSFPGEHGSHGRRWWTEATGLWSWSGKADGRVRLQPGR